MPSFVSERLNSATRFAIYSVTVLLGIGYAILYVASLGSTKLTQQISVTSCPENISYDEYFCSGIDLTNYTA